MLFDPILKTDDKDTVVCHMNGTTANTSRGRKKNWLKCNKCEGDLHTSLTRKGLKNIG